MNNQNPIKVKKLEKNDILNKNIAFKNNWAKYTIYTFDDTEQDSLTLRYSNSLLQGSVAFKKE